MEKFEGYDPEVSTIQQWLDRFEMRCSLLDVPADKQAKWCRSVVGGPYQEALAALETTATLDEVKTALLDAYGTTDASGEAQEALLQLRQGQLSLKQLAVRAQYLADVALKGADAAVRQRQAVRAFLRALPRRLGREVERTRHDTMDSARKEAERQARLLEEDERESAPVVAAATTVPTVPRPAPGRPQPPTNPAPRGACFHCQQLGHYRRDCPLLSRRSRPRSGPPPAADGTLAPAQFAAWFAGMLKLANQGQTSATTSSRRPNRPPRALEDALPAPLALPAPPGLASIQPAHLEEIDDEDPADVEEERASGALN